MHMARFLVSHLSQTIAYIEVSSVQVNLSLVQQHQLRSLLNPLGDSDCYGVDLYIHARNFLKSLSYRLKFGR